MAVAVRWTFLPLSPEQIPSAPISTKKRLPQIRFFSRGNEFTISETGVSYRGTGGSFCEYMFGVEKPLADMEKEDVLNRLIMFGAFMDEQREGHFYQ